MKAWRRVAAVRLLPAWRSSSGRYATSLAAVMGAEARESLDELVAGGIGHLEG